MHVQVRDVMREGGSAGAAPHMAKNEALGGHRHEIVMCMFMRRCGMSCERAGVRAQRPTQPGCG